MSGLDSNGLQQVLTDVRLAQRSLDGAVLRLGVQANILAKAGRAAGAEETVRGGGAVSARQAKREADRTRAAETMPGLARAAGAGEISGEHIDVMARHTSKLSEEQRSRLDHDALVERAKDLPVETFERRLRREVREVTADGGLAETVAKQAESNLRHWFDRETGMGKIFATLDPELYERITTAIDTKASSMASAAGEAKDGNLSARALAELVNARQSGTRQIPSVSVHVDYQTFISGTHGGSLCQTEGGHDLSVESVRRMCCDATVRRVVFDERGVPLDVGRKVRTATDGQWAALKAIYSSCAWDGCEAPVGWCQAHHLYEWERGGVTDLDNLIPLCSRHHHRVHEGQWRLRLLADRSLRFLRPDGQLHATVPTPMRC